MTRRKQPPCLCAECRVRDAEPGRVFCRPCREHHETQCADLGLDPRTGGPVCLPGEPEWQARIRHARDRASHRQMEIDR